MMTPVPFFGPGLNWIEWYTTDRSAMIRQQGDREASRPPGGPSAETTNLLSGFRLAEPTDPASATGCRSRRRLDPRRPDLPELYRTPGAAQRPAGEVWQGTGGGCEGCSDCEAAVIPKAVPVVGCVDRWGPDDRGSLAEVPFRNLTILFLTAVISLMCYGEAGRNRYAAHSLRVDRQDLGVLRRAGGSPRAVRGRSERHAQPVGSLLGLHSAGGVRSVSGGHRTGIRRDWHRSGLAGRPPDGPQSRPRFARLRSGPAGG